MFPPQIQRDARVPSDGIYSNHAFVLPVCVLRALQRGWAASNGHGLGRRSRGRSRSGQGQEARAASGATAASRVD